MNKCANSEIQELLPDLLHDSLSESERRRVEAHIAGCAACAEELEVLRAVKSAAVFVPVIDANRIAHQIPPYRTIAPVREQPSRTRTLTWLVAAGMLIVAATVGGVLKVRGTTEVASAPKAQVATNNQLPPVADTELASSSPATRTVPAALPAAPRTHSFALATDVDGLSDDNLMQLMDDMGTFEVLPAAEPEPVFAVDAGENSGQD